MYPARPNKSRFLYDTTGTTYKKREYDIISLLFNINQIEIVFDNFPLII